MSTTIHVPCDSTALALGADAVAAAVTRHARLRGIDAKLVRNEIGRASCRERV